MTEAYIVATARSPIGRALQGLARTACAPTTSPRAWSGPRSQQVPGLDPGRIEDLLLGCGMPGGEQGMNLARIVAVLLGLDGVPGTTVNRYCSSSLQTTRMAFHAIKAGEGDVFVSAGVECVSRYGDREQRLHPGRLAREPAVRRRRRAHRRASAARRDAWVDPRETGALPDAYIAMGQTAENVAALHRHHARRAGRVRGAQPEPRRGGDRLRVLGARHHPGHPAGRHGRRRPTTARAPASPSRRSPA